MIDSLFRARDQSTDEYSPRTGNLAALAEFFRGGLLFHPGGGKNSRFPRHCKEQVSGVEGGRVASLVIGEGLTRERTWGGFRGSFTATGKENLRLQDGMVVRIAYHGGRILRIEVATAIQNKGKSS